VVRRFLGIGEGASPDIVPPMSRTRVLHWNGKDVPEELRELPPGTYMIEAVESALPLTPEEDTGLSQALGSLRAGEGRTVDHVRKTVDSIVRR
jgi:hypothetical protein